MSKSVLVSLIVHILLFAAIAFSSRAAFKPAKKIEIYRVGLAPMPQPRILKAEDIKAEDLIKPAEKIDEKAVPVKNGVPKKKEEPKKTVPKKGSEKGSPAGLPDIKPQIYTGSGRGFTYSYYLNILLSKIGGNWNNPFEGKDIVLKAIVYFEVDKTGKISNVRIEDDSGDDIYNESALRAITLTKKLPPLPQEFSDDYLKVHLEFLTAQ
jgi:TonB family protein